MTRAPFVFGKTDEAFARTPPTVFDTTLGWRFENPKMAARFPLQSMGETAENVAEKWKITRDEQDAFALASHEEGARAADAPARSTREIVAGLRSRRRRASRSLFANDESPRADASLEALAKLQPVVPQGRHGHRRATARRSTTARARSSS